MDSKPLLHHLRKVVPEINLSSNSVHAILHSDLSHEDKVHNILHQHFKSRRNIHRYHTYENLLNAEAKHIHYLYPSHELQDIYHKLKYFVDMPNRKEIVLRLLTMSKETINGPVKRTCGQYLDNANNNAPMIKVRKLEEPATVVSASCSIQENVVPFSYDNLNVPTPYVLNTVSHDVYFPGDKPATVTSSDVETAVTEEKNEPSSTVMGGYEVPDIMEHFALPIINLELPCTMADNSEGSELSETQLPYVSEETIESITVLRPEEILVTNSTDSTFRGSNDTVINQNSTDSTSKDSNSTVISLDHSDEASQIVLSDASSEVPRDSQDSAKTELYSLDDSAIPEKHHAVTMMGPTCIKINLLSNVGERGMQEVDAGQCRNIHEPYNNAPSTSRQNTAMNNDIANFDLVTYVREITHAREEVVRKQCKKLNLRTDMKPMPFLLNMVIDNILSNVVDSEDSDVEHLPDVIQEAEMQGIAGGAIDLHTEVPNDATNTEGVDAKFETMHEPFDKQLVQHLCLVFSDACPNYIKALCRGKVNNNEVLDNLITEILNTNGQYPKRPRPPPEPECLPENQLEILKEFLPDADPDYLSMMLDKFEGKPDLVKSFLNEAMEKRDYPTLKDYQRRQQLSAQQKQYTTEFNVENFVKLIPDPEAFFKDPSRKLKISNADSHYVLVFMRNKFNRIHLRTIQTVFSKNHCNVAKTIKDLEKAMTQSQYVMKSVRRSIEMPNSVENIPLLQELAYYTHKAEIDNYLKQQSQKEIAEREEAKAKGVLKTCNCCYDEEVVPKDIHRCENGCEFCKSCIVKSSEVLFGEGKLDFPCLMNCSSNFSLQTLQIVLSPKLFSKIAQKKALEEIKSAGIEELEMCPFCDFATIPAEGYNIFTCMNPECMKESCRMCKEPSHIPLRCDEIEKDEDVRARTFVENKMTEALLRKCWKCGVKFFKEEGCNKMTCSCGAQMCYVCGKPVDSYKHFNGNGGDRFDLCPLYSDTNVLNKENVLKGAQEAKAEIGNVNLKYDPTVDINKHYQERTKMYPHNHLLNRPPPPFLNNVFQRHIGGLRPVIDPEEPVILPIVEPLLHEEEPPLALNWQPPNRRGVNNLPPRARYPPMAARLNAAAPANPFRNQAPMNVPQPPLNRPQQIPFPYM
ncbi:hypothetical protein Zmor_004838 [Zophobas morio]|uniref:RING-type domain-containing protein n=1 Tax=Zophobas morio TaxID=2755281 RepID=A0AA38IM30_9CUCU|nr:hypothetical protein Zmor_004838 [Zophobas morio]